MRNKLYLIPVAIAFGLGVLAYSFLRNPPVGVPVPPPPPAVAESPAAAAQAQAQVEAVKPPATRTILITSKPSGASIWINAKETGLVTPSQVEVPGEGRFILMLKKRGYAPFVHDRVLENLKGAKFDASLHRPKRRRR